MKTVCASCSAIDYEHPVMSSKNKKPLWLENVDYVSQFIENHKSFAIKRAPKYNQIIELNLGKNQKGKKILYWAAQPESSLRIKDAKSAYNDFRNSGVALVNENGIAKIHIQCPQPYKTTKKKSKKEESFYRHFHFVYSDKAYTLWEKQLYTQIIICEKTYSQVIHALNDGMTVVINALPSQYYAKDHIPNSYNLFHETIQKMSQQELFEWLQYVIKYHYPKLYTYIKNKDLKLEEVPIICYCAHKNCDAGYKSIIELLNKGFIRVDDYKGGMEDYHKCHKVS